MRAAVGTGCGVADVDRPDGGLSPDSVPTLWIAVLEDVGLRHLSGGDTSGMNGEVHVQPAAKDTPSWAATRRRGNNQGA